MTEIGGRATGAMVSVALGCSGCLSLGAHLTATPVAPGEAEMSVNADALLLDRGFGPQWFPNPEVATRFGVTPDFDWGTRFNMAGFEANVRYRLARPEAYDLSVVPYAGAAFVPATNRDTGLLRFPLGARLLFGWHGSPNADVVFGVGGSAAPQAGLIALRGDFEGAKVVWSPAGTVGGQFPCGEMLCNPEVNVHVPYDPGGDGWLLPTMQAGVALKWH